MSRRFGELEEGLMDMIAIQNYLYSTQFQKKLLTSSHYHISQEYNLQLGIFIMNVLEFHN